MSRSNWPVASAARQAHGALLRAVRAPLFWKGGVLLMAEPHDMPESEMLARPMAGSYEKPFIRDHRGIRYLDFDMHTIQSAMCLDDPFALDLAYTRKMTAFLLFNPEPREVLLLGLGGWLTCKVLQWPLQRRLTGRNWSRFCEYVSAGR